MKIKRKIKPIRKKEEKYVPLKLKQVDAVDSKKAISIRLDLDVLNYFKEHHSPGYQSEINRVLGLHVRKKLSR